MSSVCLLENFAGWGGTQITDTFLTQLWRQISLGLGVSTDKAILLLKILNSLYHKKMRVQPCHHRVVQGEDSRPSDSHIQSQLQGLPLRSEGRETQDRTSTS